MYPLDVFTRYPSARNSQFNPKKINFYNFSSEVHVRTSMWSFKLNVSVRELSQNFFPRFLSFLKLLFLITF